MIGNMPCTRECPDRTGTCHDTCEPFLEWKRDLREKKAALRREEKYRAQVADIHIRAIQKTIGRKL